MSSTDSVLQSPDDGTLPCRQYSKLELFKATLPAGGRGLTCCVSAGRDAQHVGRQGYRQRRRLALALPMLLWRSRRLRWEEGGHAATATVPSRRRHRRRRLPRRLGLRLLRLPHRQLRRQNFLDGDLAAARPLRPKVHLEVDLVARCWAAAADHLRSRLPAARVMSGFAQMCLPVGVTGSASLHKPGSYASY